jgi:methyl-accepting chemotaxis protein
MRHLKVWQKLALMWLLFMVSLAVMFLHMAAVTGAQIEAARKELEGVQYSLVLRQLLQHIQQHRAIAIGLASGDLSFQEKFVKKTQDITKDVQALERLDAQLAAQLRTQDRWQALKTKLEALLQSFAQLNTQENRERHTQLIAEILQFLSYIGETSGLILDPELDSYYLIDIVMNRIPPLSETLGQARTLGITVTTRGERKEDEKLRLIRLVHSITVGQQAIREGLARALAQTPSLQPKFAQARQANEASVQEFLNIVQERLIEAPSMTLLSSSYYELATKTIDSTFMLYDSVLLALVELLLARVERFSRELFATIIWMIAGIGAVSFVSFLIGRDITRSLGMTVAVAEEIAAGNLAVQLTTAQRSDEVGSLLAALERMVSALREKTAHLDQINRTLQEQFRETAQSVIDLTAATNNITASIDQVVAAVTETASSVSQTATTADEAKQAVSLANQKTRDASDRAQQTVQVAREGEQAVADAVTKMSRLGVHMGEIADTVGQLSKKMKTANDILATVHVVAEQSNLLAINAAIEAAKAGAAGKGFSVVAQEVRLLAQQSKLATTRIGAILGEIAEASAAAVHVTEQGARAAQEGMCQSTQAGEAIRLLAGNIMDSTQAISEVAATTQQQVLGMNQVVVAMETIKRASKQNVIGMTQIEEAVQSIRNVGQRLHDLMPDAAGMRTEQQSK